jgi:hypothetical protein
MAPHLYLLLTVNAPQFSSVAWHLPLSEVVRMCFAIFLVFFYEKVTDIFATKKERRMDFLYE